MTHKKSNSNTAPIAETLSAGAQPSTIQPQSAKAQPQPTAGQTPPTFSPALMKALTAVPTGEIPYRLTNDYMFRAVMQTETEVLKGLLAALLGMKPTDIKSLEIRNPITLGDDIWGKDVILDILLILNNQQIVNIEMQVANEGFWRERSIYYAARAFSNLNSGEEYNKVRSVVNIGILDFNLFPEKDVFYSKNVLMDTESHQIYSSKFGINVLCLTQIKKAKKEKKDSELVRWAEMFRAKTWEDLKELAKQNEVLSKMVVKLAELTGVEKIRMQCEAREHYAKEKRTYENMIKEQEARAEKEKNRADDAEARADNVESELQEIRNQLQEQQEENQRQQETILELQRRLAAQQ